MSLLVLIVARHYPPLVSGGARRPYLLAVELRRRGHRVCVLSPVRELSHFGHSDDICVPHVNPETVHNAMSGLSGNILGRFLDFVSVPDRDLWWCLRAARTELPFIPDVVFTSSPPESGHIIGLLFKLKYGARWVADLRDHWVIDTLHPVRLSSSLRRRLEIIIMKALLKKANFVTAVTESILNEVRSIWSVDKIVNLAVIPNFGPNNDMISDENCVEYFQRPYILHTGSFELSDPKRHLRFVLDELSDSKRPDITLVLVGKLTAKEVEDVRRSSVSNQIIVVGPVSLTESWRYQSDADALLLVVSDNSPHVPGKLFEYISSGKPILTQGVSSWMKNHKYLSEEKLSVQIRNFFDGNRVQRIDSELTFSNHGLNDLCAVIELIE